MGLDLLGLVLLAYVCFGCVVRFVLDLLSVWLVWVVCLLEMRFVVWF